jgi:hypothetical protein
MCNLQNITQIHENLLYSQVIIFKTGNCIVVFSRIKSEHRVGSSVQHVWKFIKWYFLFMAEIPTADEIEVFKILQKCLELRDSYLYREEFAPWEKEIINDPCTPKPNPNPFTYVPEPKSEVP